MAKTNRISRKSKTHLLFSLYRTWRESVALSADMKTDAAGRKVSHSDAILAFCKWVVEREHPETPLSELAEQLGCQ